MTARELIDNIILFDFIFIAALVGIGIFIGIVLNPLYIAACALYASVIFNIIYIKVFK